LVHPIVPPERVRGKRVGALFLPARSQRAAGRFALHEWLLWGLGCPALALALAAGLDEVGNACPQAPVVGILCEKQEEG